jgi:hypothetical protein
MKRGLIIAVLVVLLGIVLWINALGERSGVTSAQVRETLPGDSIIPDPWISIDRAATLPVPASEAWPWVQQLGNSRAGWYAPLWIENTLHDYAASTTIPKYQNLKVGDIVPDWGGGSLKVLAIVPDQYILYGSVHGAATSTEAATQTNYDFTWALVLENDTPTTTSFHLRLRLPRPKSSSKFSITQLIPPSLPGFIDYATDAVMFAGLKEQLSK